MTYYKVLDKDGHSQNGGSLKWSLPQQNGDAAWTPGMWHHVKGDIEVCSNGLHLTETPWNWAKWDSLIFEAEGKGDQDGDESKVAFRHARLLRPMTMPDWWTKAHEFVATIGQIPFLKPDGKPCPEWKLFPTRAAAGDAAWDAAGDAARDAAGDAARDAAWDAARAAAGAAAGDAARAAARAAARDAAGAAAGDAARAAAWDAAWDARLYVQCDIICADLALDTKHRNHACARWEAWQKGFGLLCDVDGVLYVYERI